MKRILVVHSDMCLGGAETSLIGLLDALSARDDCEIKLMLLENKGEMLPFIPEKVVLLPESRKYAALSVPIKTAIKRGNFLIAAARLLAKAVIALTPNNQDLTYRTKRLSRKFALPFLPKIEGNYDICLSFIDPHYIMTRKVSAQVKFGWLHTDYSIINASSRADERMWGDCDRIVNVSESCKAAFDRAFPRLTEKSVVIGNVLPARFVRERAKEDIKGEMNFDGIKILSIGRFCKPKNFDNVPDICMKIRASGLNCRWYLIGYGSDEQLIRDSIDRAGAGEHVIVLGKRDNPYPYIAACDIYAQPSRYEGRSVAVREAQTLGKCVVITDYATSSSQLTDGYDGVVVPMDNDGCAKGIIALLNDAEKIRTISENCRTDDHSDSSEAEKIFY